MAVVHLVGAQAPEILGAAVPEVDPASYCPGHDTIAYAFKKILMLLADEFRVFEQKFLAVGRARGFARGAINNPFGRLQVNSTRNHV